MTTYNFIKDLEIEQIKIIKQQIIKQIDERYLKYGYFTKKLLEIVEYGIEKEDKQISVDALISLCRYFEIPVASLNMKHIKGK